MRVIVHRGAAAVAFLAACILMLQVADSTGASPVLAAVSPLLKQVAPFKITAGREFYITNRGWIPFGRSAISVPILMYHYVRPQPSMFGDRVGYNLSVSPQTFQIQMRCRRTDITRSTSTTCARTLPARSLFPTNRS